MQKTLKAFLFRLMMYISGIASSFADFLFFLLHPMFTRPGRQIEIMRRLNEEREWRIPEEEFARIKECIPRFPFGNSVAVVLVPYMYSDPYRVFVELCRTIGEAQPMFTDAIDVERKHRDFHVALLDEKKRHRLGLCWEVINLYSHRGKCPMDVRDSRTSPHAGILAAALLHQEWLESIDRVHGPSVWLPGYKAIGGREEIHLLVPCLSFEMLMNRPVLEYDYRTASDPNVAVPEFAA